MTFAGDLSRTAVPALDRSPEDFAYLKVDEWFPEELACQDAGLRSQELHWYLISPS